MLLRWIKLIIVEMELFIKHNRLVARKIKRLLELVAPAVFFPIKKCKVFMTEN